MSLIKIIFYNFFNNDPKKYRISNKIIRRFYVRYYKQLHFLRNCYGEECDHKIPAYEPCIKCEQKISQVFKLLDNYSVIRKMRIAGIIDGQSLYIPNNIEEYIRDCLNHAYLLIREMDCGDDEKIVKEINWLHDIIS